MRLTDHGNSYLATGLAIALLALITGCASAPHGEGTLGPHGGYIKMPGEFHVEVVPHVGSELMVYLLDLQSREPLTLASGLTGKIDQSGKVKPFTCELMADHYDCKLPPGSNLSSGELTINAVRRERVGRPATYELPFHLPAK